MASNFNIDNYINQQMDELAVKIDEEIKREVTEIKEQQITQGIKEIKFSALKAQGKVPSTGITQDLLDGVIISSSDMGALEKSVNDSLKEQIRQLTLLKKKSLEEALTTMRASVQKSNNSSNSSQLQEGILESEKELGNLQIQLTAAMSQGDKKLQETLSQKINFTQKYLKSLQEASKPLSAGSVAYKTSQQDINRATEKALLEFQQQQKREKKAREQALADVSEARSHYGISSTKKISQNREDELRAWKVAKDKEEKEEAEKNKEATKKREEQWATSSVSYESSPTGRNKKNRVSKDISTKGDMFYDLEGGTALSGKRGEKIGEGNKNTYGATFSAKIGGASKPTIDVVLNWKDKDKTIKGVLDSVNLKKNGELTESAVGLRKRFGLQRFGTEEIKASPEIEKQILAKTSSGIDADSLAEMLKERGY